MQVALAEGGLMTTMCTVGAVGARKPSSLMPMSVRGPNALRFAFAAALALLVWLCIPPEVTHAGDQWCETDPLVGVRTPAGTLVPLFVTTEARGLEYLPYVLLASITSSSSQAGGGTNVQVSVTVPSGPFLPRFETRSTVSTGPLKTGAVLASTSGYSQRAMNLQFRLDVP
jgi:hypothetical protein